MDTDQQKNLEQIFKCQLMRLNRMIRNKEIFELPATPKNSEYVLRKRIQIYNHEYEEFKNTHEIICLAIETSNQQEYEYFQQNIQENFDEAYFYLLELIDDALSKIQRQSIQNQKEPTQAKIKLPVLKPPTFTGKYTDWTAFTDQFNALIHNNHDLPTVQKLQYLLAALEGPAADIIKHLPISATSYEPARDLLKRKYENKRAIFTNAMVQLLSFQPNNGENIENLQKLAKTIHETNQTFTNIGVTSSETILAYLIMEKLPAETRKEFGKRAVKNVELPTISDIDDHIQSTIRTLEMITPTQEPTTKSNQGTVQSFHQSKSTTSESNEKNQICALCSEQHSIRICSKFLEMPTQDRCATSKMLKLCYNCLSATHITTNCRSRHNCNYCGNRHHSLLHSPTNSSNSTREESIQNLQTTTSKAIYTSSLNQTNPIFTNTLLSTAMIRVKDRNGSYHQMRALIDMGGEASAITEEACQKLQLQPQKCNIKIDHLDNAQSKSNTFVEFNIQSHISPFKMNVSALVFKSLIKRLPSREIHYSNWPHITNLQLADPKFNETSPIDIILGAEVYGQIILPQIMKGPIGTPTAQSTELGWILFGKTFKNQQNTNISMNTFQITENNTKSPSIPGFGKMFEMYRNNQVDIAFHI